MRNTPLALLFLASPALAGTARFDGYPEGIIATSFTEAGITFSNLDNTLQPIGTAFFIAEQADGTLAGQPGFSPPNCLGSVGWSSGSGASFGRTKSYEMSTGQTANHAALDLYLFASYAGNTVTLEAWQGAQLVGSDTIVIAGGFTVQHYHLEVAGVDFDRVRLFGAGPQDGGVFFGLADEVTIDTSNFEENCPGDGTLAPCPCSNSGLPGHGCENSAATGGAELHASGSVAPDTVVLSASGVLPATLSIFLQGTTLSAPLLFGDGLRCVDGFLHRLSAKNASAGGTVVYPEPGELSVSDQSALLGDTITPGSLRYYQTYYRDPAPAFCPGGSTYNVTNGLTVHW
jgi:hypothetical protein